MSVLKNCDFYVAFMNIVSGTLCIFILSEPHHHVQVEDYHYNPIIIIYVVPWDLFASLTKAWCLFKGLTWPCRDSKGILIVCSFMSLCLVENTSSVKYPKLLYHVKSGSLFTEQFCLSATANSVVTIVFRGGATGGQGRDKGAGGGGGATMCLHHCPSTGQGCRRTPGDHCHTGARCVTLQMTNRQEERDTSSVNNNMFTGYKQTQQEGDRRTRHRSLFRHRKDDSPISSYLIAVPRFAFSSDSETKHFNTASVIQLMYGSSSVPLEYWFAFTMFN